jgi:hypothetical protein
MSFFDSIPQPPPAPVRRRRRSWEQSDEVIPASVPGEPVLIRTEQVAVAIGSIRAYPNGFEFTAHVRTRDEEGNEWGGYDPLNLHGRRDRQTSGGVLLLGLMYADGRRGAATGGHWQRGDDAGHERLIVDQAGSSASERRWDGEFWVHPLPPGGPVTFVASWPDHGVAETRAELDGAAIRAAAARAVTLWPEEPETDPGGQAHSSGSAAAYWPGEQDGEAGPQPPGDESAGT